MTYVDQVTKSLVARRAGRCCEYCRCPERYAPQAHSVEHVLPRTQGGGSDAENLALACQGCNNHKYTKTQAIDELSGLTVPLFHPRRMRWGDHFVWSHDYTKVIALSTVGRVTIRELRLNRPSLVRLRRVLYAAGEHPPKATVERRSK